MKNKYLSIVIISILASVGIGFFIGRSITTKRTVRIIEQFTSFRAIRPSMEDFRKKMLPLIQEQREREKLLEVAIVKEDTVFAYKLSDEIAGIHREMLRLTIRHLVETEKLIPPELRRRYIEVILKPKPLRRLR